MLSAQQRGRSPKRGGIYQIGSAADYAEFAALVNGGQWRLNAILTADIDLGTDIDLYKIGVPSGEYLGVLDGAGHTITIDFSDCSKDNQGPALFRSVGRCSVIKRLKVQGSLTTAKQHAAAIANYCGGVIRDCWADVIITATTTLSDGSAAAIVGQCNKCSVVENCLAKVVIDASGSHKFGGVAAWSDAQRTHFANNLVLNEGNFDVSDGKSAGLVRNDNNLAIVDLQTYNANSYTNRPAGASVNNYVTDDFGFLNKGTTVVTAEELASGKICYQLNSDQSQIRSRYTSGSTKIENCEIAVTMHNDIEGDATAGGIMGVCRGGGSVLVNNCLVNCTFIGEKANAVGGICGWKDGAASSLTVKNTIILSQYTTAPEPTTYMSDYISRNGCTIDNVYYAERSKIEGATERGTLASGTQLASGEITYKLNGGTSEGDLAWFQTIGTDETPRLFGGDVVYFIDGQYMNKVAGVSGDANGDGKVDAGDVQTVLIGIANGNEDPAYDANGDGKVDAGDVQTILITIANQ